MVRDILDAKEFVISILPEIDGGMLPSRIANLSRDLRWSKKRYFVLISREKTQKVIIIFKLLTFIFIFIVTSF